ncbi:conserved hypothetical protein [Xanthomonas citri pv. citri]|nr:conserved hypothetical protein [Xanthomonas citri pv. citri]CEE18534.1 conserved hypothetical protein [Xanthomonas citri pv. citri]CEE19558.1 conserved hypothetical protein [Xanthomonas citri pv. citri]CEE27147.1 conserved hypothetical protein [Xanthomonas citri pv. citri]CEE27390.1 conserved hypothetical protein [Xanthomonas citri pv. citri]
MPAAKRVGPAQGVAEGAVADQPGIGALSVRTGKRRCLGACHRRVCVSECMRIDQSSLWSIGMITLPDALRCDDIRMTCRSALARDAALPVTLHRAQARSY